MKNKIKFKISLIICLSFMFMSINFWGIKQKVSLIYYFLRFLIRKDETDYNLYKALSHGFIRLKNRVLKQNKRLFIEMSLKQRFMKAKQKSQNRITLIVDDTCDGEKHSRKSRKLHRNRDNSIKKIVKTHNIVVLAFTIGTGKNCIKHIIDFRVWTKSGKKKTDLFIDMLASLKKQLIESGIQLTEKHFPNLVVVFDSGYSYDDVLKKIDKLGFYFIGKYHHRKKKTIDGTEENVTTWLKSHFHAKKFHLVNKRYHIKCQYYKDINISNSNWRYILCLFKRKGHKRRPRRFLVTNLIHKPYYFIIERYQQRYYIEGIFRDLKQLFELKEFHRKDLGENFDNYFSLCVWRYDFVQEIKRENHLMKKSNGYVVKLLRKELNNIGQEQLENWFTNIVEKGFIFNNSA